MLRHLLIREAGNNGMPKNNFEKFASMLRPLYSGQDIAHDIGHIKRIHKKALSFAKGYKVDPKALSLGAVLHGVVREQRRDAEAVLRASGVDKNLIQKAVRIAIESQATAIPKSSEGKILHDAHLCEGGDFFIVAKCMATALSNGYPLSETYEWINKNIITNKQRKCHLLKGKREYMRKMGILKAMWKELRIILDDDHDI